MKTLDARIGWESLQDGRIEIYRYVDGELETCAEIELEQLPTALALLQYDEFGCLLTTVEAA